MIFKKRTNVRSFLDVVGQMEMAVVQLIRPSGA